MTEAAEYDVSFNSKASFTVYAVPIFISIDVEDLETMTKESSKRFVYYFDGW